MLNIGMNVGTLNRLCGTNHSAEEWEDFLYPSVKDDVKIITNEKDMIIVLLSEISKALRERNKIEHRKTKALEALSRNVG